MEMARVAEGKERRHGGALRVLIADDERDTVDTLAVVLESEGHIVQRAYGGAEVLPAVPAFRPDVIVLDISIPVISGFGIAQAIRHSFTDIRRPLLIAMSGKWMQGPDRLIAQQVGFDHYLVKPCDPGVLLKLLVK
jgi:CheY-like chemotaxis protein